MRVEHLLRPQALICAPWDNLATVARRMREHQVSALAVLDGERLVALISHRDLVHAMAEAADPRLARVQAHSTPVRDIADPAEDSRQVARRMLETGQDHIAIVDGSTVLNVVPLRHLIAVEPSTGQRAGSTRGIDASVAARSPGPTPLAEPSRHGAMRRRLRCTAARMALDEEPSHVGDAGWWLETVRHAPRRSTLAVANTASATR